MIRAFPQKSQCHFPYRLRGTGSRYTKFNIKHKTEYGLFVLKLRKNLNDYRF